MIITKPAKDEIIRVRCEKELKADLEKVALVQHLDNSDIVRIACRLYVKQILSSPAPFAA